MKIGRVVMLVTTICILLFGITALLPRTSIDLVEQGNVAYVADDQNIQRYMEKEDYDLIVNLFNDKILYSDNPSCGFSKDYAIYMNGDQYIFCVARDGCPTIYCHNERLFFRLTQEEHVMLVDLLKKYGFTIPCV